MIPSQNYNYTVLCKYVFHAMMFFIYIAPTPKDDISRLPDGAQLTSGSLLISSLGVGAI